MEPQTRGPHAIVTNALIGLSSPLDSLRFMRIKKSLLVMGLAPYLVAFALYVVLVTRVITPLLTGFLIDHDLIPLQLSGLHLVVSFFIWMVAIMVFALIGPSVVNTVASPLYDTVAARTYEHFSGRVMAKETFELMIRSFLGECSKLVLWLMATIILATTPFAAFLGGPLALWFLGWTHVDRTLNLQSMQLKERLIFGLHNAPACVGLGLWGLVPGVNTVFTFLMASAGAVVVAKAEQHANQKTPDSTSVGAS